MARNIQIKDFAACIYHTINTRPNVRRSGFRFRQGADTNAAAYGGALCTKRLQSAIMSRSVRENRGERKTAFRVPIHSSVSGDVIDVSERIDVGGRMVKTVTIMTDGKQEINEEVVPPVINNKSDFINAVYESGLAGLGGARFSGSCQAGLQGY